MSGLAGIAKPDRTAGLDLRLPATSVLQSGRRSTASLIESDGHAHCCD